MSVRTSMDKTMTALENGKTKMVGLYDVVSGMSVKNKANFDIQVKSDKSVMPMWKKNIGYDKEIRLMPVIWGVMAVFAIWLALKIGKYCD